GVAAAIQGNNPALRVETHVVDLADGETTTHVANAVLQRNPRIRLLVNNAGVALDGRFDQVTLEEFNWVIDINFRAMVCLTHILLPALKAEPGSHIANVSSLFGLIAPARQAAYAASKFAVRGFTEALRHELADDGIGVTSVHPGGIRTRIVESARVGSGVPPRSKTTASSSPPCLPSTPPMRPPSSSRASSGAGGACSSGGRPRFPTCWPGCCRSPTGRSSRS
ncbi:MAG TPA: SDR family oxidoreductase, partial [Pseudonocardiaceae bacterium]|nr:SDR family oxidoreductase [Pseudonocardiaceae bacterium]